MKLEAFKPFQKNAWAQAIFGQPNIEQQIAVLFANGEQGVWYDIDPQYCFQDWIGTNPASVGAPVGLVLDRSRGLVLGPELVTNGGFDSGLSGWTVIDTAPGTTTLTAGAVTFNNNATGMARLRQQLTVAANRSYEVTFDVTAFAGGSATMTVALGNSSAGDTTYGAITVNATGTYRRVIHVSGTVIGLAFVVVAGAQTTATVDNISVRELPGNHAYQTTATSRPILRQNGATGAYYLEFDGADDFLVTNSINFTATDKMTVWAGVRKLSDAASGLLTEFSAGSGTGLFRLFSPGGGGTEAFSFGSQGTFGVYAVTLAAGFPAPVSCVVVGIAAIGSDTCLLRVNGAQRGSSGSDQGTGNYGNYPLYIGRRGGTSLPFNGHLYGLIVRGAASNDSQIKIVERYLAQKTGVVLA